MPSTLQSGYVQAVADGTQNTIGRMGKTNEEIMGLTGYGDFYEWVSRGKVYMACNQTVVTFGTALTATAVTFTLTNPLGSGVLLSVISCGLTVVTSTTAGSIVYAANVTPSAAAVTQGTPLVVRNARLDQSSGAGLAASAATLPAAPVAVRTLAMGPVTATASTQGIRDYVNGSLVIGPGTAVTIQGITIVGTGLIDMVWAEIPTS